MSPAEFTFKLTVPNDPEGAAIVAEVARHASEYAKLNGEAADAFIGRVRGAALKALAPAPGHCGVEFTAADGTLTVTFGDTETITQPLS
jgi:hypothetical protein